MVRSPASMGSSRPGTTRGEEVQDPEIPLPLTIDQFVEDLNAEAGGIYFGVDLSIQWRYARPAHETRTLLCGVHDRLVFRLAELDTVLVDNTYTLRSVAVQPGAMWEQVTPLLAVCRKYQIPIS
jgi:hypothetical protein